MNDDEFDLNPPKINVIPFIDLLLILLMIFITFKPPLSTLEANLPESGGDVMKELPTQDFYLINIKNDGLSLFINNELKSSDQDEILSVIKGREVKEVYLSADKDINYSQITQKLDILRQLNVSKVNLVTKEKKTQ